MEQLDESLQISAVEMAQLPLMHLCQWFADFMEESQPGLSDADHHGSPIILSSAPTDQFPQFELIEHAGDVGGAGNQPAHQEQSRHRLRMLSLQQAEHVVLLGGKLPVAEEFILDRAQAVIRPPQGQIGLLFEGIEPSLGVKLNEPVLHIGNIGVGTIVVQTSNIVNRDNRSDRCKMMGVKGLCK